MKCRTCSKKAAFIPLWDEDGKDILVQKLLAVTGIAATPKDGLPSSICLKCLESLNAAYTFRIIAQKTDHELKESLTFFDSDHDIIDNEQASPMDLKPNVESFVETVLLEFNSIKNDPLSSINLAKNFKKSEKNKLFENSIHTESKCNNSMEQLKVDLKKCTPKRANLKISSGSNECYECELCKKIFERKSYLTTHMKRHTKKASYMCNVCNKNFTQSGSLRRHKRIHTGERPFSCEICGKSFVSRNEVRSHQIVHNEERKFVCDICGKSFKTKRIILNHMKLHYDNKNFYCDKCGMSFFTNGNLTQHTLKVHSAESGQCTVCHKLVSNLKKHMPKHTGETPYQCHVCSKRFQTLNSLSTHMYLHKNEGKFVCDVTDCGKAFSLRCKLAYHILKFHSDKAPFECTNCGKQYFRRSDISKHLRLCEKICISKEIIK